MPRHVDIPRMPLLPALLIIKRCVCAAATPCHVMPRHATSCHALLANQAPAPAAAMAVRCRQKGCGEEGARDVLLSLSALSAARAARLCRRHRRLHPHPHRRHPRGERSCSSTHCRHASGARSCSSTFRRLYPFLHPQARSRQDYIQALTAAFTPSSTHRQDQDGRRL